MRGLKTMKENQFPDRVAVFLAAITENPALIEGATAAVGELHGPEAVQATVEFYQSHGHTITTEDLLALKTLRKSASGEELSDEELAAMAGGVSAAGLQEDLARTIQGLLDKLFPW
jgi:predicted ribosomally synthesized peptide with nif11-like leader